MNIPYHQYLNAKNEVVNALPEFAGDPQSLIRLYENMVFTRHFDSKAIALQRTGKLGTYASTLGQEAIGAAIGFAMQAEDVLVPYYRENGAFFQRNISPLECLRYWGGDERGSDFADNAHDFPYCVPIATQCLHAAGVAKALQLQQKQQAVVTVCGDGATSKGDFYEAMNVAGAWNLPLVFIVNNNQWAISVKTQNQTATPCLAQKAYAGGFDGEQVDGNDVISLVDRLQHALNKARCGEGPTLIEALTYRLCDHTTADDASRYRSEDEVKKAYEQEPIQRLKNYLISINAWDDSEEHALQSRCQTQIADLVQQYLDDSKQEFSSIFEYLYKNSPKNLTEQSHE